MFFIMLRIILKKKLKFKIDYKFLKTIVMVTKGIEKF
jgi:hypothetical protein